MSAISETLAGWDDMTHFIDGLVIMRCYATEAFTINVVEIGVISVHGCKPLSEQDLQALINMGWEAWTNKDRSGAEYRKLRYEDY